MKITIETKNFAAVSPAMAKNDIRAGLNGAALIVDLGHLWLTATDGHRVHSVKLPGADAENGTYILPRELVLAAIASKCKSVELDIDTAKLLPTATADECTKFAPGVSLATGNSYTTYKLVLSRYPDIPRVAKGCVFAGEGTPIVSAQYTLDVENAYAVWRGLSPKRKPGIPPALPGVFYGHNAVLYFGGGFFAMVVALNYKPISQEIAKSQVAGFFNHKTD